MVVLTTHRHERNRAHNFNGDRVPTADEDKNPTIKRRQL
jgi:hypothetical protein